VSVIRITPGIRGNASAITKGADIFKLAIGRKVSATRLDKNVEPIKQRIVTSTFPKDLLNNWKERDGLKYPCLLDNGDHGSI
jgi:hypothetical protein